MAEFVATNRVGRTAAVLASVLLASGGCRSGSERCGAPAAPVARPVVDATPAPQPLGPVDVVGPGYRGVILASKPGGWMPAPAQVAELEARLPDAMRKRAPEFRRPLSRYFRQYVGTIEDGKRWIEVHGASIEDIESLAADGFDPRQKELLVFDGGDSYFEARYDPATGAFDGAGPHGEA